jgi:hypothetical protein
MALFHGNRFGQIPRLIDVPVQGGGDVIGEKQGGLLNRRLYIAIHVFLDKMGNDFAVRIATEGMSFSYLNILKLYVVVNQVLSQSHDLLMV